MIVMALILGMVAISFSVEARQAKNETNAQLKQTCRVSGTVKSSTGEPVIGVQIQVKGTTTGTVADMDGNFSIECKVGDILVFSFIGYQPVEVVVTKCGQIFNVILNEDTEILE